MKGDNFRIDRVRFDRKESKPDTKKRQLVLQIVASVALNYDKLLQWLLRTAPNGLFGLNCENISKYLIVVLIADIFNPRPSISWFEGVLKFWLIGEHAAFFQILQDWSLSLSNWFPHFFCFS